MKRFEKVVNLLASWGNIVGSAALVAMTALTVTNIFLRLFGEPILGAYEFIGYFGALAVGLPLAYCAARDGHIYIDLVTNHLPPRTQVIIGIIIGIIDLGVIGMIAWRLAEDATKIMQVGELSPTLRIPYFPVTYIVAIGFVLFALILLANIIKSLTKVSVK